MQEIVGVGGGGSREQLDGGVYFFLVSRAFAPHARNNSGTTGCVELADMFPSVTWRKSLWSTAGDHSCRGGERRPLQGARA